MVISRANSIHFVKVDDNLKNIENTLSYNEKYGSYKTWSYCQRFDKTLIQKVQISSNSDIVPTIVVTAPNADINPTPITAALVDSRVIDEDTYYYFEFDVVMSYYLLCNWIQIKAIQDDESWISEIIKVEDLTEDLENGRMLKLEYTNAGNTSILDNILINYTTGITFTLYVEAQVKDNDFQGEDEVFNNINEQTLINSQLFKARSFKTNPIPEFITDKIAIGGKCFNFYINDLKFVTDGLPELTHTSSNLKSLAWTIIHNEVTGFSTDNKDIDDMTQIEYIQVRKNEAITGSWTFDIPAGYILHMLIAGHGAGSTGDYTFKLGYTPGGSEILIDAVTEVPLAGDNVSFSIHQQKVFDTAKTVYLETTGAGAIGKIYANLIYNKGE